MSHPKSNPQNHKNHTTPLNSAPSQVYTDPLTDAPAGYIGNPDYPLEFPTHLYEEDIAEIRQLSQYDANNKAAPDNNMFYEERSNHLSSKGD